MKQKVSIALLLVLCLLLTGCGNKTYVTIVDATYNIHLEFSSEIANNIDIIHDEDYDCDFIFYEVNGDTASLYIDNKVDSEVILDTLDDVHKYPLSGYEGYAYLSEEIEPDTKDKGVFVYVLPIKCGGITLCAIFSGNKDIVTYYVSNTRIYYDGLVEGTK